MGWRLAKAAHQAGLAGTLSERARLALAHICWTARDVSTPTQPAGEYFEGSGHLGRFLIGPGVTEEGYRKAGDRALKELHQAGLIEPISSRGARRTIRWIITINHR